MLGTGACYRHRVLDTTPNGDFRIFLQRELVARCKRNPRYSLRAFARTLSCDVSSLSKILRGRRPLGKRLATRFGLRLGLPPAELQRMLRTTSARSPENSAYRELPVDQFEVISDWYHFAILELMELPAFRPNARWIARRLGLTASEANSAIERLQRVGLLAIDTDGRWKDLSAGKTTTLGNGTVTAEALRRMQRDLLAKAAEALDRTPIGLRDHSTITLAIRTRDIPWVKQELKKFRRVLGERLDASRRKDEIYCLSLAFFPLTEQEVP